MLPVKDYMSTDVLTVNPRADIHEAILLMVEHNITGLPVVDREQHLVGIVSEKDALHLLVDMEDKPGCVQDYMTENVTVFYENDSLVDIADCFINSHFRRAPVLSADNKLVGLISRRDLIRTIIKLRHLQNTDAAV